VNDNVIFMNKSTNELNNKFNELSSHIDNNLQTDHIYDKLEY